MIPKHYDKWEFDQAAALHEIAPQEAKEKYEEYMEKYPQDLLIYPYYASCLINLGDFKKAEEIIKYAEEKFKKDSHYQSEPTKIEILSKQFFLNKIRTLSYQERYEEAYSLCTQNQELIKACDLNALDFYCRKKIGRIISMEREDNSYLFRQIISYQEEDFLLHIRKHMADYSNNLEGPDEAIFSASFPIHEVVEEIKKYLLTDIRTYPAYYVDNYFFKYDCCGKDYGKTVNYFKVICFHNTKEFITMCPSIKGYGIPYIDLNYLIPEQKESKVKRLSQIDKFNKRFKK